MADFLSSLFGGGQPDTGASTGPFDSGFGNRLDALFMAMASTPPGGAGGIPLLQATQVANQQDQLAAQRNAMTQALVMYGVDPKVAATAAYSPDAGKMIMQLQQQKNGMSLINGALKNAPAMDGGAPAAAPAPQMPQLPTTTPMPSLPNVSMAPTANANPSDASASVPPSGLIGADATAAPTLTAPAPMTMPGSVAPVPLAQPQSQRDAALMTYAQNKAPAPPQTQSSTAIQSYYKKVHDYWTPYLTYEGMPGMGGVAAIAKEHLSLADKYLGPESNVGLQGEIAAAREGAKYSGPESDPNLQARIEAAKSGARAPYDILAQAARYGATPKDIMPGAAVTTGAQINPQLNSALTWAVNQVPGMAQSGTIPQGGAPAAPVPPSPGVSPASLTMPNPSQRTEAPPAWQEKSTEEKQAEVPALNPSANPFIPRIIRNADGSVSNSVTAETAALAKQAEERWLKGGDAYDAAQAGKMQLNIMQAAADQLNKDGGWSQTGAANTFRMNAAKAVNSLAGALGMDPTNLPFDPSKIANWEQLTKQTKTMGFKLASSLGSRESQQVIQNAISAVPNAENTPLGFALVKNGIQQAMQREADLHEFQTYYLAKNHTLFGSDVAFTKLHPPTEYSSRAVQSAVQPTATPQTAPSTSGPVDWRTYFGKQ